MSLACRKQVCYSVKKGNFAADGNTLLGQGKGKRNIEQILFFTILFCTSMFLPIYAEGLADLGQKLIDKILPLYKELCKLSWYVGIVCIAIALYQVMFGGARGNPNAVAWIWKVIIAVVCLNLLGFFMMMIQGEINSGGLGTDLSNLGNYSGN